MKTDYNMAELEREFSMSRYKLKKIMKQNYIVSYRKVGQIEYYSLSHVEKLRKVLSGETIKADT